MNVDSISSFKYISPFSTEKYWQNSGKTVASTFIPQKFILKAASEKDRLSPLSLFIITRANAKIYPLRLFFMLSHNYFSD